MRFSEAGDRIILVTPAGLELGREVLDASRCQAEGKARSLHLGPSDTSLPWPLGPASTEGLMRVLERAAVKQLLNVTPETVKLAGDMVVRLNEHRGAQKDVGLVGRIALALSEFNTPG